MTFAIKMNFINRFYDNSSFSNYKVITFINLLSTTSSVPNQKNVFGTSENMFTALNALSDRDSEERIGHVNVLKLTNITKSHMKMFFLRMIASISPLNFLMAAIKLLRFSPVVVSVSSA